MAWIARCLPSTVGTTRPCIFVPSAVAIMLSQGAKGLPDKIQTYFFGSSITTCSRRCYQTPSNGNFNFFFLQIFSIKWPANKWLRNTVFDSMELIWCDSLITTFFHRGIFGVCGNSRLDGDFPRKHPSSQLAKMLSGGLFGKSGKWVMK